MDSKEDLKRMDSKEDLKGMARKRISSRLDGIEEGYNHSFILMYILKEEDKEEKEDVFQ